MTTQNCPIDKEKLYEIMGEDENLIRECLDDFVRDYPGNIERIQSAIDQAQHKDLEYAAHTFKGSLKYLAAFHASDFAGQLEKMAKSGDLGNVGGILSHLKKECEKIQSYIESL